MLIFVRLADEQFALQRKKSGIIADQTCKLTHKMTIMPHISDQILKVTRNV